MPVRQGQDRSGQRRSACSVRALAGAFGLLLVAGCTTSTPSPNPDTNDASPAATALAAALAQKDLKPIAFVDAAGTEVDQRFQPLVSSMGPLRPAVRVAGTTVDGDRATATLAWSWTFPGVSAPWTYETTAELDRVAGTWQPRWQPALVEASLDGTSRLSQRRLYPERGKVLGEDGDPIVTLRGVVRVGIDRTRVSGSQVATSARTLADLVDVNAKTYAARVTSAGPEAFVEAITFRSTDDARPSAAQLSRIPGALGIEDQRMLAPSRTFAGAILGTVGEATAEEVKAGLGAVVAGDQVGLSGLEKRYDEQLRGTPGVQVVRARLAVTGGASASPSPTASSPAPSPSPSAAPVLYRVEPTTGKPLTLTLNMGLQRLSERVLAGTKPASALVAVRPSTGAVLAAASGPGADGLSVATVGQYAPGSTFKVASALALLRAGLKPTSTLSCPATVVVDGRRYKNYDDYPAARLGTIDLQTALANSCNTAFIGQRTKLGKGELTQAAASLGLGTDYDVGFPSFFGLVPEPTSATGKAEAMIGQGKDEASPLAMAAVAASVSAGQTVVPHLVTDQKAESKAAPLTSEEASQLRQMMRAVVTEGSAGRVLGDLAGPAPIAKTGTAEYGDDDPPKTHAWMIAAQGDLAVAVFVADGDSGSGTAGPLLRAFLRGAR